MSFKALIHDVRGALQKRDCASARKIAGKMMLSAKTSSERNAVVRVQRIVRACPVGLSGPSRKRSSKKKRRK